MKIWMDCGFSFHIKKIVHGLRMKTLESVPPVLV